MLIGVRHEDKSRWEARVPIVPEDMARLHAAHGVEFCVESSLTRAFPDDAFRAVGAKVAADLSACPIVLGVKEIPPAKLKHDKTYVFFSHTIKGQRANMPMLRRIMDLGCTLIDYEKIVDERGRRLVFFGEFAGLAGMIDTLWALGQRLKHEGIANPFEVIQKAYDYRDLVHAREALAQVGAAIRRGGIPPAIQPFVCGFAGYGHVSQGAQKIYDLLPVTEIAPSALPGVPRSASTCYKVVFREEHMVERVDLAAPFQLQEYYTQPERYRAAFLPHVPHLTLLVNGIYWEAKYPRLVTCDQLRTLYGGKDNPRLRVIGDISCDIEGSIECTVKATEPDNPVYVYEPQTRQVRDGVVGNGPVILAVDHLPCELPVDASRYFSAVLSPFVPALARADLRRPLAESGLPVELQRATIVYRGELSEPYRYLDRHVG